MCDVCSDFLHLLESYEIRITSNDAKHSILLKSEIETAFGYIQAWPQRQCMCLYRDPKNFERFNLVVQSMICLAVHHLKQIERLIEDYRRLTACSLGQTTSVAAQAQSQPSRQTPDPNINSSNNKCDKNSDSVDDNLKRTIGDFECGTEEINKSKKNKREASLSPPCLSPSSRNLSSPIIPSSPPPPAPSMRLSPSDTNITTTGVNMNVETSISYKTDINTSSSSSLSQLTEEPWILPEVEKLFILVSKVFLLNFPLYIAYKHGTHARLDDISAEEAQHLAIFCDLHDNEIPVYLLRNITLFCNSGGFAAMMLCFEQPDLPVTTAQAITATVSNIKLWLNYGCIVQLFVPLRSRVLQYMCKLSDQNLRSAATRTMADFVWSAVRDPLDASVSFDVEGLALAFKYFTSTTLTMRLAGMAQINAHINLFNEICTTETVGEVEIVGQKIANWLTENQIIQHLFGPNLHVEVIKQAHVVLNFLAVENQITEEHIKLIWQATQLKHCSKTIFDILPALVKNLGPRPAMHLYSLLCRMDPKEHTEQSIYIASALTKLIWLRDNSRAQMSMMQDHLLATHVTASSSDSGSMDGSNSDDEPGNGDDSSLASGTRKSPIDIENVGSDTGAPPPCKQARHRRHVCEVNSEDKGSRSNVEDLNLINQKMDMKMQNHRIVNIIDNSSSEDDLQQAALDIQMHRKKSRKRRKNSNLPLTRLAHEIVEAIWDGGEDEDGSSDDVDDADEADGEVLNDSDDCSDAGGQVVPSAVLKHLRGEGPYIRAIDETHISELLNGAEIDGYSSPMSNKSEKNMADFDDEDVSPCEEELSQLHALRVSHNCVPPAFAAAAMAAAHSTIQQQQQQQQQQLQQQKSVDAATAGVVSDVAAAVSDTAANAVAVAAAAAARVDADLQQQVANANAAAIAAALAAVMVRRTGDPTDVDMLENNTKVISPQAQFAGRVLQSAIQQPQQGVGQTIPLSPQQTPPQLQQPTFKINDVCQPGNTLLWDLLQDDKIYQLGESLALEAEKALATLLCFSMDRQLRTKFIEGCLQNLASNRSVVVSLRLLPKLFASFQHFRPADTHHVTMWAERQHRMMYHFFNNIKFYNKRYTELQGKLASGSCEAPPEAIMYSHKTQVSVRLHFLSSIFSTLGSPKTFRLTLEQVDSLWEWLAHDGECSDCYFSWLQSQAKGGDQHALGIDALQHLYLKKLPELRPEEFSMVALGLFQQLCSLARMAIAHYEKQTDSISSTSSNIVGMYHLWKIALRAHNTEVSLAAIQYINMYYMGQQLRLEKEFVSQCMDNLVQATAALESSNEDENALMCVQRGLMLLNTHLETFRRRYAFHLRRWAIEGKGVCSHSNLKNEASGPAIRIVLQPAGLSEKSVLHMHACDLIAELKAEISKWWENLQGSTSSGGVSAPVLGLLLSDGPLRIITQGQELTSDYDERSLGDAGFKDNQIVYVSLGGRGARRKETNLDHPSMQPPPPKECLPTVLLLQSRYLEKLFCLMQTLGDMKPQNSNLQLHTKAQLLSRRVWDILAILPTNPLILDAFKGLSSDLIAFERLTCEEEQANKRKEIKQKLNELLDASNLQKFMYSLHIIESLTLNSVLQQKGSGSNGQACCGFGGGGVNGNVIPMDQYVRSTKGGCGASKRSSSRRRNSNESSNAKDENKRNTSGNSSGSSSSCSGSGSGSGSGSSGGTALESLSHKENYDGTVQKQSGSASAESEFSSEIVNEVAPNHDKENNQPLAGRPHKRLKRSDSNVNLNDEKEGGRLVISAVDTGSSATGGHASNNSSVAQDMKWSEVFVRCGGLRLLYEIFISGQLQQSAHPREMLNEWRHDCLASLMRVLWLLGFEEVQADDMHVVVSRPHAFMLELMIVDPCLRRLASILNDEAYHNYAALIPTTQFQYQYPYQYHHLRTGFWGRAQVVQFTMNIMVSFVHASAEARRLIWTQPEYCNWVQKFILEDPEPAVRREICAGLYRICLGNSQSYQVLLAPLLRKLISFLSLAEKMTSYVQHTQYLLSDEGKEPYGPACRDYFWLLARLVDTMTPDMVKCSLEGESEGESIDIERLCQSVSQSILTRDFYETRHGYQDDGLVGLINLMSNFVKYDPTFKFSGSALQFIDKIFEFLFDMPSPMNRHKPKCKSATSRAAAYDLLVELCKNCPKNYVFLHAKLLAQHTPGAKAPYPWDYWPRDEGRSECGYVGLTNLGATCYMASCIQHLYMMPQARAAILNVPPTGAQKHGPTLLELQRMFAYLLESERKAYNPRSFCRVYQMDHQPLNTGEQKDMAEFFIDLVSKLEEMTPELKDLVKRLFCGTLSNNVVSLDCGHVSRTAEEFYTVRCQVADMRNLQESLDEVTVKDTLEGDNMYTCSQCGKKVRAEKRACFKKLPQILCFNTMRYTFNMVTMLKEKVNTHFSFPMLLNMTDYVEKTLMPHQYKEEREKRKQELEKQNAETGDANKIMDEDIEECLEYELVGVTVHTGTADGGHYYSFIKERNKTVMQHDRWFLFNDAEVKPFDPSQIAAECFGGEMTSKTYDSVTEKYMDFSFEKTNSAYMLFYERRLPDHLKQRQTELLASPSPSTRTPDSGKTSTINDDDEEAVKLMVSKKNIDETNVMEKYVTERPSSEPICEKEQKTIEAVSKKSDGSSCGTSSSEPQASTSAAAAASNKLPSEAGGKSARLQIPHLNKELEDWIWQDNRQFLQDRNIFEHTYFNFMWQICGHIPQTLLAHTDVTCMAAKLSVSFFIETFIHAKEKPTMVPWIELLTKQFNASQEACEWFLTHMSIEPWWPVQVLIQCPNQMVRQMFQRLVIHVIQRLRSSHAHLYLKTETDDDGKEVMGNASCVTRFISSLILLMEHGAKAHLRHLSEFFGLLFEFSRMGDEETVFLLRINVIKSVADFYLGNKTQDCIDVGSDNDDNSSDEALSVDKTRPASLDKMIALVANLVERSRGQDFRLRLSTKDYNAIAGGKGFPFLYQQIKDNINPHQTKHLIHALCRWDDRLANQIITMLFSSVTKHTELCGPFFKLLTLLTETQGGPSGLPCFSQLVLQRVWDAAEYCPQSALDWLAFQAPKNKIAHAWILQSADNWVEQYLLAHNNSRVRNAAAYLLVSLVPSQPFRANFRTHSLHKLSAHVYRDLNSDAQIILHNIINLLLRLLRPARAYADIGIHGTTKLTTYFSLLSYCMVSKTEKLMIGPYMRALWDLFHPRLSEPSVPAHHNKHALLAFWHHSIVDCPENALIVANCHEITRNIAFNYILADHDDSEIVAYNRAMLPAYYGLLRLCCEQSRALTRQLAAHQNLQWAFKNITPHPTQYAAAVDELFKLMTLFATRNPDASEQEQHEVTTFRRTTLSAYLTGLDARVSWGTLINALRILVDNDEDRLLVIYNGGIEMCFEALHTLHSMHHEATACHVSGDLQELLSELVLLLTTLRMSTRLDAPLAAANATKKQLQQQQQQQRLPDAVKRLATFLNTFNPPEICRLSLEVLKELVRNPSLDVTSILAPILINCHLSVANAPSNIGPLGPYFPRRGTKAPWPTMSKNTPRPPRPMVQMSIPHGEILQKGVDIEYDAQVEAFYRPYHDFLDVMMRMAVNTNQLNETLVKLSCLVAIEAAPLHFNLFPKFWVGIYNNKSTNKYADLLINNQYLVEYIHIILRDERVSLSDHYIRNFLEIYYPKISAQLPIARLLYTISYSMHSKEDLDDLCGDLFAIRVIAQCTGIPTSVRKQLRGSLKALLYKSSRYQEVAELEMTQKKKVTKEADSAKAEKPTKTIDESDTKESPVEAKSKIVSSPKLIDVKESAEDVSMEVDTEADTKKDANDANNGAEAMETDKCPSSGKSGSGDDSEKANSDVKDETVENDEENTAKTVNAKSDKGEQKKDETKSDEEPKEIMSKIMTKQTKVSNKDIEESVADSSHGGVANTPSTTAAASVAAATLVEQCKGIQKKPAEVRLFEEHEKRIKLLLTMETYIKSILVLMQRDESSNSPTSAVVAEGDDGDADGEGDEGETVADVPEVGCKRNASASGAAATATTSSSPPPGAASNTPAVSTAKKEEQSFQCNEKNDAKGDASDSRNFPAKANSSTISIKDDNNSVVNTNTMPSGSQSTTTTTPTTTISATTAAALHSQQI